MTKKRDMKKTAKTLQIVKIQGVCGFLFFALPFLMRSEKAAIS